jgi:hypothetical protein
VTEPGRNDKCPCGSGKKYKLCCGATPQPQPAEQQVEVAIEKKIVFTSRITEVMKQPDGKVVFSHVVVDGGQAVEYAFVGSPQDAAEALKALSGGLVVP